MGTNRVRPSSQPAATVRIRQIYQRSGYGPGDGHLHRAGQPHRPIPPGFPSQPADPAAFGLPAHDDGSRGDPLLGLQMTACTGYEHDFGALGAAPIRIVLGVGTQSGQLLPGRAVMAVAERLGTTPVTFPGGHDGFPQRPTADSYCAAGPGLL